MTSDTQQDGEEPVVKATQTMLGDLMHCVIDLAKALPEPWQQLSEARQRNWLDTVERQLTQAIENTIGLLASRDWTATAATVDTVTFKSGGVKAALKIAHATQGAHQIADSAGQQVLIIICDHEEFTAGEGKPEPDPDQKSIPTE